MAALKAWEDLCGGPAAARGIDYTSAKAAARDMRRDYKGQRAWRADPDVSSPRGPASSASPRRGRPSSSTSSTSPFLSSLVAGGGRPSSPGVVFGRPRTASAAGPLGFSAGSGNGVIDEGEAENRREELRMVGARSYEHWLAEKAQQVAAEKARLHRIQVRAAVIKGDTG